MKKNIIELDRKIQLYKNGKIDEDGFRSLRLARGIYGQRQEGVQMIRIKLPFGKLTSEQLHRIADVSDEYSTGRLHITTRQDIQIHYVSLDRTPELWADLEKSDITLREACGNAVRNITASETAGIDPDEPFDVSPYADAVYKFFLRNPICQELGRKFKISFSATDQDSALSFMHDLGQADIVLYDVLISNELLDYAPRAIKVYAGKRKGFHKHSQDEINKLIVNYAYENGHVVRLKGGIAESFWVITGCTSSRQLSLDVELAARSSATVVILMGMHKLAEITKVFQLMNKGATPVAIIQNGTMADQKSGVGTIDDILELASHKNLSSPAIIIIGDVVKDNHQVNHIFEKLELDLAS